MERLLVATKVENLSTVLTVDAIAEENLIVFLYNKDDANSDATPIYRGSELTADDLVGKKAVQFAVKRNGQLDASILIPLNRIANINYKEYVAGQASVIKLGNNASAATALSIPSVGEGNIRLVDLIELYNIDNFPANISVVKRVSETALQYLQRVILAINNDPIAKTLVTALLESDGTNYQIKLTAKSPLIKLGVAVDGIFENYIPITVTERIIPQGKGTDMAVIEKELSAFKGNGNYMHIGDLYYKEPIVTNVSTNYDVASITSNIFASPTASTNMALGSHNLLVSIPTASEASNDLKNIISILKGETPLGMGMVLTPIGG